MNSRFLLYGIFIVLIWNTENASSVLLTSTLMTGLMGGFLLGRMSLGTFLGLLSNNNGTRLPSLPNLSSILPSLPALITQEEDIQDDIKASDVSPRTSTSPPVISTMFFPYTPAIAAPPNIPQVYTYNYPVYPSYAYQTTTTTEAPFKLSVHPIRPIDVPISLDNKVRDRFIRQLAIMDPLNCLPKIFCEVSADPLGATFMMNHGTINNVGSMDHSTITQEEMVAYEYHLQRKQTTTTTPKPTTSTTTTTTTTAPAQNDEDQSGSEEDDISGSSESEEDDDDSFEQYRKEHEHKIEMQALEEMVDDIEDPQTYMYVLRDKQRRKAARKKYKEKQRNKLQGASSEGASSLRQDEFMHHAEADHADLSPAYGNSDYSDQLFSPYLNRRMSAEPPRPPPPMQPPMFIPPMLASTEAPLHDMFSGDPFFEDFSSGRRAKSFGENFRKGKRRVKRQSDQKADLMSKYRVAYMVAEKYRSPDMCNVAFPSCPYRAKTILSVVNRLESGMLPFQLASDKKNYFSSKNNIHQFKNTLQAIERLNKATLLARARGEPINIDELAEAAASPSSDMDANTSQNIVNEFQQVVAKIKTAKMNKRRKHKRKKNPNNQAKYDAVHYYKKAQMETLKPKERVKSGILHTKVPARQQDDELQIKQQWGDVPSFKQTFKDMFKVSKVRKERPKLTTTTARPKTKINGSKPKSSERPNGVEKYKRNTTTIKPVTKFSENDEDDEKDARQSEEAISRLIGL